MPLATPPPVESFVKADGDPSLSSVLHKVERLGTLADRLGTYIDRQPPGQRGTLVVAVLVSIFASAFFGIFGAIGAVWVHDAETRGRLGARLDDQDAAIRDLAEAINKQSDAAAAQAKDHTALVLVVEGLLDEHEVQSEWLPRALEAGFARQPIPRLHSEAVKLRRRMPLP